HRHADAVHDHGDVHGCRRVGVERPTGDGDGAGGDITDLVAADRVDGVVHHPATELEVAPAADAEHADAELVGAGDRGHLDVEAVGGAVVSVGGGDVGTGGVGPPGV